MKVLWNSLVLTALLGVILFCVALLAHAAVIVARAGWNIL